MNELIDWFKNAGAGEFLLGLFLAALVLRILIDVILDR